MKVLNRIIGSQKAVMTIAGTIAVSAGASTGVSDLVVEAVAALFGVLVVVQGALDFKHGSPSDKTGKFSD